MRQFLCSLAAACILISSFNAGAQTSGPANDELAFTNQPEFIDGLFMDAHNKKTTIKNIVEVKKNSLAATVEAGFQDKKFTVINNQVVLVNNDRPEVIDSNHVALKNIEPVQTIAPADDQNKEQTKIGSVAITEQPTAEEVVSPAEVEIVEPVISKYAEMLSVDPTEITNYILYHFIDKWYGTHYKWGGTDKAGIDCSAFSQKLYSSVYGVDIERTAREQHRASERIKHADEANEGDLIFFRIHRLRISHVGVYLANGYFVHASRSKGVVISNLGTKYWRSRYAGCGRIAREDKPSESDFLQ